MKIPKWMVVGLSLGCEVVVALAVIRVDIRGWINAGTFGEVAAHGLRDVVQVGGALDRLPVPAGRGKGREQYADQDCDNGDDDEQLNKGEGWDASAGVELHAMDLLVIASVAIAGRNNSSGQRSPE